MGRYEHFGTGPYQVLANTLALFQTGDGVRLHPPNRLMTSTIFGGNHKNDLLSLKVKVGFFYEAPFWRPFFMAPMINSKRSTQVKKFIQLCQFAKNISDL